jgi:serpin B
MKHQVYPEEYIGHSFSPEVKNVNRLTLAFAKAVGDKQSYKQENLIVSPYNALTCLSMVAKGADGETKAEMAKTLFGAEARDLDREIKKLGALKADILKANKDKVVLQTANGVWVNANHAPISPTYAGALQKDFDAEVASEPFSGETVKKVNGWAERNTNGLIKEVLEELSPDDYAVLASALYFKGDWTSKFDKSLTADKYYHRDAAPPELTAMMRKEMEEGDARYIEGDDYEAIALTYGKADPKKEEYPSMRLILARPKDARVSARDWLASQAGEKMPAWLEPNAYEDVVGTLELPRMDIKNKVDLIPALQQMGIKKAFKWGAAEFAPMTDGKASLFVSQVSHDTVFKTNEEGSEAAAVTTAVMGLECMSMPPREIDLKFDRSFALALQDVKTGAILFVGAVNKPNNEMKPDPRIAICPQF